MSINGHGEMTSKVSRGRPEGELPGLPAAALIAVLVGAVGSVGFDALCRSS